MWGIALVGAGGMANNYRNNYVGLPGCAYRLVVDINETVAGEVAQTLGVTRASTRWEDALAPDIDIVDISTPNFLHAAQAVALLRAGKHVILQKPMAPTLSECDEIVAAARESGRQAAVYMSDLEDPIVWDLRDIVQGGYVGDISSVRARYAHRGGLSATPSAGNWRGSADKTGGGAFMQLSIHHTNLVGWMLGDTIDSVVAYAANRSCAHIGGDDTSIAIATFARTGVPALFESAWNADGSTIEIHGTAGSVKMLGGQGAALESRLARPFAGRVIQVTEANQTTHTPASGNTRHHCRPDNPLNQHVGFVRAVQRGEIFPVDAAAGRYDVAVVKAVYRAAETGCRVRIAEIIGGHDAR